MKTNVNTLVMVLMMTLLFTKLYGQSEYETINKESDSSYLFVDVNYINDAVFFGRKDSIAAPYLYPSIAYNHKSGLYASGSLSFLTKSNENRVDLFLISGGYQFSSKKFEGDISITKYFFNNDSYNVISEVEADITGVFSYDFKVINLGIASSMYFNSDSNSDFFLAIETSHDFISDNLKFQVSPTVGAYFGSQNFYEQYYINNRFGNGQRQGKGQGSVSIGETTTSVSMQESSKFNIMAIEFSLPMWYVNKSFVYSFLPAYVLPQTPSTLTVDSVVYKENLKSTFYFVFGVGYIF